jgi:hypothetical protein
VGGVIGVEAVLESHPRGSQATAHPVGCSCSRTIRRRQLRTCFRSGVLHLFSDHGMGEFEAQDQHNWKSSDKKTHSYSRMLTRVSSEGHWEEFLQGEWVKTLRAGRCQTIPLEDAVRIICKDRLVVRDAVRGIHTLGNRSTDIIWSLLPAQSVEATWAIGTGGIMVDDQAKWGNQGEKPYAVDEEDELVNPPLDEAVLEHVVIGLGTVNNALLAGGTAGLIVFCCWKNKKKSVGALASDDELGDDAWADLVNDTGPGGEGPSRWRDQHGPGS